MARGGVPTKKPNTSTKNWGAMVRNAWQDDWHKKETAYEFSNGRKFEDPAQNGGPYVPEDQGE